MVPTSSYLTHLRKCILTAYGTQSPQTWPRLIGIIVARTPSKEESCRVAAKSSSCGSLTVAIHHGISGIELSE
uniref:Uncharacterized protein n=1 Tax=Trichogramma kaykai TaxID=54128 RepID=A0ABD2VZ98_9HYME